MNTACHSDFLRSETGTRSSGASSRVFLAAFGKHPAWNDHIDDLGFETATLAQARQLIYAEGIAGQINSGAWERLDPALRVAGFDHFFLWQRGGEILVGIMADSRDGKGRSHYPMILCVHTIGVALEKVAAEFCPTLERAMLDCRMASAVDQVEAILERTRRILRALGNRTSTALPRYEPVVGHPKLGPDDEGLARILYHLHSQCASWYGEGVGRHPNHGEQRAAHVRVPKLVDSPATDWPVWLKFIRSQLATEAPVLLVWPRAEMWLDLVVGMPTAADFFSLRANAKAVPIACAVPYSISAAFRAGVNAVCESAGADGVPDKSIFSVGEVAHGPTDTGSSEPFAGRVRTRDPAERRSRGIIWGIIGALLAFAVGVFVYRSAWAALLPQTGGNAARQSGRE